MPFLYLSHTLPILSSYTRHTLLIHCPYTPHTLLILYPCLYYAFGIFYPGIRLVRPQSLTHTSTILNLPKNHLTHFEVNFNSAYQVFSLFLIQHYTVIFYPVLALQVLYLFLVLLVNMELNSWSFCLSFCYY